MPKVSVVIPTYNRSQLLKAAISSVLNQTFQDFEIIVVDDGSTDNTKEVVAALCEQKIKYIRHEVNQGEAKARNAGILITSGEYIAFLDDDDEWLPKKLELQVDKFENSPLRTGLIYSHHFVSHYIKNKLTSERLIIPSYRGNMYNVLMNRNFILTPSVVLMRRKCMEKIGLFDPAIAFGLDRDYWIRISQYFDFEYIAEPLARYRLHENRLSSNIELRAQGAQDLAKKYGNNIISTDYYKKIYLPLGIELCKKGEMIKGITALLRSIRYFPMNRIGYFYFGIALLGPRNFKRAIMFKESLLTSLKTRKNKTNISSK